MGWWGFFTFYANFVTIAIDIAAWRKYNQLLSPQGIAVHNSSATATRRLFGSRRNQLILVGFVLGILAVGRMIAIAKGTRRCC